MDYKNQEEALKYLTRRSLLKNAGYGVGSLALGSMLSENLFAGMLPGGQDRVLPSPHFAPKAKNVIFLFMAGAPSQLDLFDDKPFLRKHNGEAIPEEIVKGERFAFIKGTPKLLGSPHEFAPRGKSGQMISSLLPHHHEIADDICIIRSMQTDQFNHAPAQLFMNTGIQIPGRPSMGSWMTYGLGTENSDLPGFVVLISGQNNPDGGKSCWSSGFLPSQHQGVELRSQGDPVLYVSNPDGMDAGTRRDSLDVLRELNRSAMASKGDPEIAARIEQYELAYRMQTSVPELMEIDSEPAEIHEMYGTDPGKKSFANNCLLARRLVERGCRFIQLYHRGWDNHGDNEQNTIDKQGLPERCREVDQASAALIKDLKQRGMLDDTIVIWGGEFGRTPMNEARDNSPFLGRDHHPRAFTMWAAGGGFAGGTSVGATDELGYNVVETPVHVHDLHATILNQMGLDHTRLTYRYQGRDFRLTDVSGEVIPSLIGQ
jgi:hypothetical protein